MGFALALALGAAATAAAPSGFVKPAKQEKCPVCGMFVYKYPDWTAQLVFRDGSHEVFDGAKDLFRYFFDMQAFGGTRSPGEVAHAFVTDYYSLEPIDAHSASYVIGSDVFGPMGKEAIPFARRAEAEEFLRDHHGRAIVGFGEIERELPALVE